MIVARTIVAPEPAIPLLPPRHRRSFLHEPGDLGLDLLPGRGVEIRYEGPVLGIPTRLQVIDYCGLRSPRFHLS